jgi:hypothetical protein
LNLDLHPFGVDFSALQLRDELLDDNSRSISSILTRTAVSASLSETSPRLLSLSELGTTIADEKKFSISPEVLFSRWITGDSSSSAERLPESPILTAF